MKKQSITPPSKKYRYASAVMYHKTFSNGRVQTGLYTTTGKWIKWLSYDELDIAIEIGVPVVDTEPRH